MNNKEYGVKLDVDISKFTEKLKDAQNYTDTVMKEIKDRIKEPLEEAGDTTKNAFEEKIGTIAKLGAEVGTLTMKYADVVLREGESSNSAEDLKQQIKDLNAEMEKEGTELGKVGDALGRLYEDEQNASSETSKFAFNIKNLFNGAKQGAESLGTSIEHSITRGISSIKRFSLSLLGIQSVYSMITKAVNSYMAYDTQMTTKIRANWVALGAMFAPIVEKLVGLFQKLIAYVNVFWKAFTGKNLIDMALKKVQKTANGTTKSVKALNKELATIDEITNLNFDQGGGGDIDVGGAGDYDISDALEEIKNLQLDPKLVEIMTWLGTKLREAWDWCVKLKDKFDEWGIPLTDVIKLIAVIFGASEVARIVSAIAKIIGVSGGTAGLYGMIAALIIIDGYLAKTLYDDLTELGKLWRQQQKAEERLGESRIKTMHEVEDQIKKIDEQLKSGQTTDEYGNDLVKKKESLIQEAQDSYVRFNEELKDGVDFSKAQVEEMEDMRKKLEKITNTDWKSTVDVEINAYQSQKSKNWWDNFMESVRQVYTKKWESPGRGGSGTGFANGNVAYEPTYAQFGEYAGARSNPEITAPQNMMRETLFEALSDALPMVNSRNGDTILYVNGKELARATYQDFKNEGNRLGSSSVAIRRG